MSFAQSQFTFIAPINQVYIASKCLIFAALLLMHLSADHIFCDLFLPGVLLFHTPDSLNSSNTQPAPICLMVYLWAILFLYVCHIVGLYKELVDVPGHIEHIYIVFVVVFGDFIIDYQMMYMID